MYAHLMQSVGRGVDTFFQQTVDADLTPGVVDPVWLRGQDLVGHLDALRWAEVIHPIMAAKKAATDNLLVHMDRMQAVLGDKGKHI